MRCPFELKWIRKAFSSWKMPPTRSASRESSTTCRSLRGNDYMTAWIWTSLLQLLKRGSFTIMFSAVASGSVEKTYSLSNWEQNFIQRAYGEIFKELSLINCKSLIKQWLFCSMKATTDRKSLIFIQQREFLHFIHCSICYPHLRCYIHDVSAVVRSIHLHAQAHMVQCIKALVKSSDFIQNFVSSIPGYSREVRTGKRWQSTVGFTRVRKNSEVCYC